MCKIHVIDAPCGAGKSYAMANMVNTKLGGYNYIYVTPRLKDFETFGQNLRKTFKLKGLSLKNISDEDLVKSMFNEPKNNGKGGKLADLKRLITRKQNIMTTHALFKICDSEFVELVNERNYILILDESLSVVEPIKESEVCYEDLIAMKAINLISIDEETGLITYNADKKYPPYGAHAKQLYKFKNNSAYVYKKKKLVWTFPIQFFECFKEVYLCTFMFYAQLQKYYFKFFGIEYEHLTIKDRKIIPYERQFPNLDKLHICQDAKLNAIGEKEAGKKRNSTLSINWYKYATKAQIEKERNAIYNFVRNKCKATADRILWTTYSEYEKALSNKGYSNSYVSWTTRGTEDYVNRDTVAYMINLFLNPSTAEFFKQRNIYVDVEQWALSEMIQFIWRSAIRRNKDINVYIPSSRMRGLLERYIHLSEVYDPNQEF
jgi:hypothetical protein